MGFENPAITWSELEGTLSGRTKSQHSKPTAETALGAGVAAEARNGLRS